MVMELLLVRLEMTAGCSGHHAQLQQPPQLLLLQLPLAVVLGCCLAASYLLSLAAQGHHQTNGSPR